jgi:uncharacterized delta-60 repeat protein
MKMNNKTTSQIAGTNFRKFFALTVIFVAIGAAFAIVSTVITATNKKAVVTADTSDDVLSQLAANIRSPLSRKEYLYKLEADGGSDGAVGQLPPTSTSPKPLATQVGETLDPTLNVNLSDGYTRVHAITVQPATGKLLVGGTFPLVNGVRVPGFVRLNADGTLDQTFNQGNTGGSADAIVVQPDGKIVIGGGFSSYNGVARSRVARLNADGTLDLSFNPGVGANGGVLDLKVQSDGKVLIAGSFNQYNGVAANRIVRLNNDGTLDATFTPPTITANIQEIALQADGRVIIGGNFSQVGGIPRAGVARLNTNGTHDTSFDPLNNTINSVYSLAIQPDGKILVGSSYSGTGILVRLNSNGTLDGTFAAPISPGVQSSIHRIIVLSDTRILVAGFLNDGFDEGYGVARLNSNGSVDGTFTPQLVALDGLEVFAMAVTPAGKIVAGGDYYRLGNATSKHIAQINNDGSIDTSFTTAIEGLATVRTILRQADGKLYVGGAFKKVNNVTRFNLVRLSADGTIDPTFSGQFDQEVLTLAIQPDGKLLAGGSAFVNTGGVARFNTDGTIDPTFVPAQDVTASFIYKILVQPDGKIVGVGLINVPRSSNGATAVYRVNNNGSEDTGFSLTPYNGAVLDAALSTDGKIYIAGAFVNFAASGIRNLARLNTNGTIDTTYNTGTGGNGSVYGVAIQPDGKVVAGGFFTTFNGQYARGVIRTNADGTLDQTFNPGLGISSGGAYDVFIQSDNKILVGGSFSVFNNVSRRGIARLNSDGTLDGTLTDQVSGFLYHVSQQPDGKVLIGGAVSAVNGVVRSGIARLSETDLTPPANDNFSGAESITGTSGSVNGNNTNATAEAGEPAHAGITATRSVWYRWTAPDNGLYSFTTSGSSFDTTLGVYTGGAVSALTEVASNDDSAGFDQSSRVVFHADQGAVYNIAVDGKNNSAGISNLIWRQAARTYRIYAQTGNGNISPRIPTIIATRVSDGSQYPAVPLSPGVFELDLPVDNATYLVNITGPDIWAPNSFTIDNSGSPDPARITNNETGRSMSENPQGGGGINLVVVARTVAGTVSGTLAGLTSVNGVTVFLGSEGGPNPIAPEPCAVTIGGTGAVVYSCQFIVDTRHQIKPSLNGTVFAPVNRQYPVPITATIIPGPGTMFTAVNGTTYNITGQVTANGGPLTEATVYLTGSKTHSYITASDGNFAFNSLPAGGNYTVTVVAPGYAFVPQSFENLQSNQFVNMVAQGTCNYSVSTPAVGVPAGGGERNFTVNTTSGCQWSATNSAPWLTMNIGSGSGTGNVYFTALPNVGMPRTATINVAGQAVTVEQANGCTFTLTGGTRSFPASGGSGTATITASDQGCTWTPAASDYCMITGLAGGTGNGPLNYTVSANRGVARTGAISAGGQIISLDQLAAPGTHRTRLDFDADGKADIAVYRPSNGVWYILNSGSAPSGVSFGLPDDVRVPADYDGDGKTDVAVYRPSNGAWYRYNSGTPGPFPEFVAIQFGSPGDIPAPGDYDHDGKADLAVYRPSTGTWYQLNSTAGFRAIQFGLSEDKPAPADFDGDGETDIALFRPSSGIWFIMGSTAGFSAVQFGADGDVRTQGDYDGDGKADVSVFRPSNSYWYRLNSSNGEFIAHQFGLAGDVPVPGDYNGDQSTDIAVYRPSSNLWFVWSCTTNPAISTTLLGTAEDIPIAVPLGP